MKESYDKDTAVAMPVYAQVKVLVNLLYGLSRHLYLLYEGDNLMDGASRLLDDIVAIKGSNALDRIDNVLKVKPIEQLCLFLAKALSIYGNDSVFIRQAVNTMYSQHNQVLSVLSDFLAQLIGMLYDSAMSDDRDLIMVLSLANSVQKDTDAALKVYSSLGYKTIILLIDNNYMYINRLLHEITDRNAIDHITYRSVLKDYGIDTGQCVDL